MAAVDYFLKIDGIKGESKDSKHKDELEVLSFSFGAAQQGTASSGGGMGAGKVKMSDFTFTVPTSTASPKLLVACANGQHIASATLTCRKAGKDQQEFLVYKFTDILVSSHLTGMQAIAAVQQNGSPAGQTTQLPAVQHIETITFNYSKIEMSYKEQNKDGTLAGAITGMVDVKGNTTA